MSRTYDVVGLSPGLGVGAAWSPRRTVEDKKHRSSIAPPAPPSLPEAFEAVAERLERMAASFRADGAPTYADILEAEAMLARDPSFVAEAVKSRRPGPEARHCRRPSARWPTGTPAVMESLESPELRERATDIRHVGLLVAERLEGRVPPMAPPGPFMLVAEEVSAPDLLEHASGLVGAVSRRGGAGSHAAIVARSWAYRWLSGVQPEGLTVPDGVTVCVDGDEGSLVVAPG